MTTTVVYRPSATTNLVSQYQNATIHMAGRVAINGLNQPGWLASMVWYGLMSHSTQYRSFRRRVPRSVIFVNENENYQKRKNNDSVNEN